jgi:hypothetical protein
MRSTIESYTIEDIVKTNLHLSADDIHEICIRKQISVSFKNIVLMKDYYQNKDKFSMAFIYAEWRDQTPTNHRLTKTYRQLIKNEIGDGEVVGKKVN